MDRSEKEALVAALQARFSEAEAVVVTRQSGMTVAESTDLRTKVREAGSTHQVAKNRLVKLALKGTKFEALAPLFTGPTAITVSDDPVSAAKVTVGFAKKNDKLTIVGGAMGVTVLDVAGVSALATMPSLDELRGKLVGLLQAPATKVAGVVQAPASQLARVFAAYSAKDEAA
jgi:large subunit ribosomal protein L10|tara:strand:+ start:2486 stop:3004 length:519 start_codon:yes stop_codon:yes gene_type:complete